MAQLAGWLTGWIDQLAHMVSLVLLLLLLLLLLHLYIPRPVRLQFHPFLPAVMRRLLQRTTYHSPDPISITLQWPREYVYDDGMDKMRCNALGCDGMGWDGMGCDATELSMSAASFTTNQAASKACQTYLHTPNRSGAAGEGI